MAEQWWTTVLLGTTAEETGPDLPAHGGNGCDPEQAMAEEVVHIDAEMVRRYAEVSGDFSEHHFDAEAARRSGFAGPFLHGLCTMALCARAVVGVLCPDDPSRLRRFAVQFASPAYLDEDLTVRICSSIRTAAPSRRRAGTASSSATGSPSFDKGPPRPIGVIGSVRTDRGRGPHARAVWHSTHVRATGRAARRSAGIAVPHRSHVPYVPSPRRTCARSISSR